MTHTHISFEIPLVAETIIVSLSGPNSGGGSHLVVRHGRVDLEAYGDEALGTTPRSYSHEEALAAYARHAAIERLREAIARMTAANAEPR